MSAKRSSSWIWILLVCFAAMAATVAGQRSWGVTQLHAGKLQRGQSTFSSTDQSTPADLAMAVQTISASAPDASSELMRDAVSDSSKR